MKAIILLLVIILSGCTMKEENQIKAVKLYEDLYLFEETPVLIYEIDKDIKIGTEIMINEEIAIQESYPGQIGLKKDISVGEKKNGIRIGIHSGENIYRISPDRIVLLDVREEDEYREGHLEGAINISLKDIENGNYDLPKDKPIFVYCRSGNRSGQAQEILEKDGYFVINIGGVIEYEGELVK